MCCIVLQCVWVYVAEKLFGSEFSRKCAHMDTYTYTCIYTYIHKCVGLCSSNQCGSECVAVCCSVLQCVWVYVAQIHIDPSALQCVAVCGSVLQCVAVCCSVLQSVAVC